jgi:hypothetical protein
MNEKPDEEIRELATHLSHEQLQTFVALYAGSNNSFKKDMLQYFNPKKPAKPLTAYRDIAFACFKPGKAGRYNRNYNFYEAASIANEKLSELLSKANYFVTQNNFSEAAAIAQSIIEAIPRNIETVDDSDGELGDTFDSAVNLLLEIADNEMAIGELKKEIFRWVAKEVKEKIYSDYGFDEIHTLLIPYTQAAGFIHEALEIADERIRNANEYHLESAVLIKLQLLKQNNLVNEIKHLMDQYLHLVSIRQMKVNELLEDKRYREAIVLIKEGIQIADKEKHPGTVGDWNDQLLQIYTDMEDHANVIKYAEHLFYTGRDGMKYYHILKNEKNKDEWPLYLDKLLSQRKNEGWPGHPDSILGKIYIDEQYWDRLMDLVEKSELNGLETYEQYLKSRFPEKLRDLFVEKVISYAEKNASRTHYQYAAGILRKIRTYPGGNEAVEKLLSSFKIKYKARKAMMEELRGV